MVENDSCTVKQVASSKRFEMVRALELYWLILNETPNVYFILSE